MIKKLLWILCCTFSVTGFAANGNEKTLEQQQVRALFDQGKYAELDRLYLHYRPDTQRVASGTQALDSTFYWGLEPGKDNKDCACSLSPQDPIWQHDENLLKAWIKHSPNAPAPRIRYAELLREHGWAYRGESYAGEVKPENWPIFQNYLDESQKYLQANKTLGARDPQWYVVALWLARDQSVKPKQYQALLDEATHKYPSYYRFYDAAVQHALPRWGGSTKAIEQVVNYALKANTAAHGQEMYARVYYYVFKEDEDIGSGHLLEKTAAKWPRLKLGMNQIIANYPSSENLNRYARLACTFNDLPQAALIFKQIKSYSRDGWMNRQQYYACQARAFNTWDEYLKTLSEKGSADPVAQQKYKEYQDAYAAYKKKISGADWHYNPHDIDEVNKKKAEFDKADIE